MFFAAPTLALFAAIFSINADSIWAANAPFSADYQKHRRQGLPYAGLVSPVIGEAGSALTMPPRQATSFSQSQNGGYPIKSAANISTFT